MKNNDLKKEQSHLFNFGGASIRAQVDKVGVPWFNANDVCDALDLTNPHKAVGDHVDAEDVAKRDTLTPGGNQLQNHINESGLYALIFGSAKPEAKAFKRWVTHEVLPSIRKTGEYVNLEMKAQLESLQERHEVLSFHMDEAGKMLSSMGTTYQALYKVEHAILDKLAKAKGGLESKLLADEVIRQTKCSETDYFHAISDLYTRYKIKTDRNGNWALTR